jgi:nucleoside-diphosphate-sugar epimerase
VLDLGGSGYIGSRLCALLGDSDFATPVSGSTRRSLRGVESVRVDTTDAESMARALHGVDAVVNCVAGNAQAIAMGAQVLADAAAKAGCARIVHLSSMSVYGRLEGNAREDAPLDPSIGWYAKAKCEAEQHLAAFASRGGAVVMFRPGCVWGPGSDLWVGRIGRFLRARRLGDLGIAGDGWSNLVHVDDVCAAIVASLRAPALDGQTRTYNLAAPDSPRWNDYFIDLALAIGATPVLRLSARRLRLDAMLAGPPLKIAEMVLRKAGRPARSLPDPLPPGLLGLWERHLRLDSALAQRELGMQWTPYAQGLRQAAAWFLREHLPASESSLGAHKAV